MNSSILFSRPLVSFLCALIVTFFGATSFAATTQVQPGDDVESAANALNPGDELVLADGTYEMSGRFSFRARGTEQAPIIIRAADGATPLIHRPNANQNIWDIDAEYLVLRGLHFSGGSAGLRFEHAQHVTIEACEIFDTGDVAIRMNDNTQNYAHNTIIDNHIHDTSGTGEGMYLGCNNNGCQFSESLIARNYVHNTDGPDVSQGDGIEIKEGGWGNTIRDNVIHDTGYPCILTYSTAGNGGANIIERNAMWACGDNAIQTSQDAVIRNNIILGAAGSGIALQPHQAGTPQNLEVVHNTVINTGDAIALRGAAGSVVIANNAAYSNSGSALLLKGDLSNVDISGNVGTGGINGPDGGLTPGDIGADFVDADFGGGPMDVFPAVGSALIGAGDTLRVVDVDFNNTPRQGSADVGAYRFDPAGNAGWVIAPGFKDISTSGPGDPDAGSSDAGLDDASSSDAGVPDAGSEDAQRTDIPTQMPDTRTGNDAANSAPDASQTADASQTTDTGSVTNGEETSGEDGCGCNSGAHPNPLGKALILAGLGVSIGMRRRRASR